VWDVYADAALTRLVASYQSESDMASAMREDDMGDIVARYVRSDGTLVE